MKLAIVLSTHAAQFQAVAFKGDFEANVARIASYGYDGVELAIRDPKLVNAGELEAVVKKHGLEVPAIGQVVQLIAKVPIVVGDEQVSDERDARQGRQGPRRGRAGPEARGARGSDRSFASH